LFYPAYYQSLSVRLYNFNSEAIASVKPIVITYVDKADDKGNRFQQVLESREFGNYQDALSYTNGGKNRKIVGRNELESCVPLDKVTGYQLVHASTQKISGQSEVKVFQRLDK
jgi:hypothetical protein